MSYDGWKDDPAYLARDKRFRKLLTRRDELLVILRRDYPEVIEYLEVIDAIRKG